MSEKKSVLIHSSSRPIKVAYIVPHEENEQNHWILDSVFQESYTRWGGAHTLIVPAKAESLGDEGYKKWLNFYDPDFIYTYVPLNDELVEQLGRECFPISFLAHKGRPQSKDDKVRWRDFTPDFSTYFNPVASLSTLLSPQSNTAHRNRGEELVKRTLVTQYNDPQDDRFVADNFGIGHGTFAYTNPRAGLFETLCFAKKHPKDSVRAGSIETESTSEILSKISTGDATTFSVLSRIHSEAVPRITSFYWQKSFSIFVGNSYLDRIAFWNSRHFTPVETNVPCSLIIDESKFDDQNFVKELGKYINAFNFMSGNGGGPYSVSLRSTSRTSEDLERIRRLMERTSYSNIYVNDKEFALVPIPEDEAYRDSWHRKRSTDSFRHSADNNEVDAHPPKHFQFNPPKFGFLNRGDWAVDLDIERHKNLSKYSNVTDSWQLPRNQLVPRAFTQRLCKVTRDHLIALIPSGEDLLAFRDTDDRVRKVYELGFPTDKDVFRHLILDTRLKDERDLRSGLVRKHYSDLEVSDKGQNLRGVISMFDRFSHAYSALTNRVWRDILRQCNTRSPLTLEQLFSLVPNQKEFKADIAKKFGFSGIGKAHAYMKGCFTDDLEFLVNRKVFFQVYSWRCLFCGHANVKSLDELQKRNECSICKREHFSPVDLEWKFKINSFVSESLFERNGLTVLWALGFLRDSTFRGSFYFLPEVDLFEDDDSTDREEIDILCAIEGKFCAVEVKKTATLFTRKPGEIEKFIGKLQLLRPDRALLVFEEFSDDSEQVEAVKKELLAAKERLKKELNFSKDQIRIVIASEVSSFKEYSGCFEPGGPRGSIIFQEK